MIQMIMHRTPADLAAGESLPVGAYLIHRFGQEQDVLPVGMFYPAPDPGLSWFLIQAGQFIRTLGGRQQYLLWDVGHPIPFTVYC